MIFPTAAFSTSVFSGSALIFAASLFLADPDALAQAKPGEATETKKAAESISYEDREMEGWKLKINRKLIEQNKGALDKAMELLQAQLKEIVRIVPAKAVAELQKVPLWFNPEYPGVVPRAEFHPGAKWLSDNGRNPAMAKGVEFTNVRIFEAEVRRMPAFVLHELAHSYHDLVLPMGFGNPEIKTVYEKAKASGKYESVERKDSEGRITIKQAYAIKNPQEYFAESTEAYFSTNDFFPYNREQLKQFDPEMFELLGKVWGVSLQ